MIKIKFLLQILILLKSLFHNLIFFVVLGIIYALPIFPSLVRAEDNDLCSSPYWVLWNQYKFYTVPAADHTYQPVGWVITWRMAHSIGPTGQPHLHYARKTLGVPIANNFRIKVCLEIPEDSQNFVAPATSCAVGDGFWPGNPGRLS